MKSYDYQFTKLFDTFCRHMSYGTPPYVIIMIYFGYYEMYLRSVLRRFIGLFYYIHDISSNLSAFTHDDCLNVVS